MLDALLNDGFAYHDSESERFAGELEAAADEARSSPAHLVQFLRFSTHTIGEHLGDWPRAVQLGDRVLDGRAPDASTAKAWAHLSIARLLAGDGVGAAEAELAFLAATSNDFRGPLAEARFMLASALIGSRRPREAAAIYEGALGLAQALGDGAPARAIAVASNNLASDLLEAASRSPAETALMRLAADTAHEYWLKCGDWMNDERALYLKAMVANALDDPNTALKHVERALAIIAENGGEPIDEAFLQLTRAQAFMLAGDTEASERALAQADAAAGTWDDEGLRSWYAAERARATGQAAAVVA
ncbi:MAG TPA: hypothetical protein VN814_10970 [Caulobacteraceae bacterium]|nr:hypothetical protein [Caulobacteraceae bacterium]